MGDDIGSGLLSMAVCFDDFRSTNVVQLSNRNLYFCWFRCHHPLITQLTLECSHTVVFYCSQRYESVKISLKCADFCGIIYDFVFSTHLVSLERIMLFLNQMVTREWVQGRRILGGMGDNPPSPSLMLENKARGRSQTMLTSCSSFLSPLDFCNSPAWNTYRVW